jgi:hypothetical protein
MLSLSNLITMPKLAATCKRQERMIGGELKVVYNAYRVDQEEHQIPFNNVPVYTHSEETTDILTPKQRKLYTEALYSKAAVPDINELKNKSLIRTPYVKAAAKCIIAHFGPKGQEALKYLFFDELPQKSFLGIKVVPSVKRIKKVDNEIARTTFNRLTFKDLGITKDDILAKLRAEKLVTF